MSLFKQPKTIESSVESMKQVLSDLRRIAEECNTIACQQDGVIAQAEAVKVEALLRKECAENTASKIAEILGY